MSASLAANLSCEEFINQLKDFSSKVGLTLRTLTESEINNDEELQYHILWKRPLFKAMEFEGTIWRVAVWEGYEAHGKVYERRVITYTTDGRIYRSFALNLLGVVLIVVYVLFDDAAGIRRRPNLTVETDEESFIYLTSENDEDIPLLVKIAEDYGIEVLNWRKINRVSIILYLGGHFTAPLDNIVKFLSEISKRLDWRLKWDELGRYTMELVKKILKERTGRACP